jgi:hypothetical protein
MPSGLHISVTVSRVMYRVPGITPLPGNLNIKSLSRIVDIEHCLALGVEGDSVDRLASRAFDLGKAHVLQQRGKGSGLTPFTVDRLPSTPRSDVRECTDRLGRRLGVEAAAADDGAGRPAKLAEHGS